VLPGLRTAPATLPIPFASLADGTSTFQVPFATEHTETAGWLASLFLRAEARAAGQTTDSPRPGRPEPAHGLARGRRPAGTGTQPPALGMRLAMAAVSNPDRAT
jgi:hypothetical protein